MKVHMQVTVPAQIKMLKGNINIKTYICGLRMKQHAVFHYSIYKEL